LTAIPIGEMRGVVAECGLVMRDIPARPALARDGPGEPVLAETGNLARCPPADEPNRNFLDLKAMESYKV
jgi:hypothetical protein